MRRKSFRPTHRRTKGDDHGFNRYEGIIGRAISMLKDGIALPVDMQMQLLEIGVNVEELEDLYG